MFSDHTKRINFLKKRSTCVALGAFPKNHQQNFHWVKPERGLGWPTKELKAIRATTLATRSPPFWSPLLVRESLPQNGGLEFRLRIYKKLPRFDVGLHGRSQDSMQPNSSLGLQGLGERIAEVAKLRTSSQRGAAHLKKKTVP